MITSYLIYKKASGIVIGNINEIEKLLNNIALLRHQHGLSKRKMSQVLGIGIESLSKIEKGICPKKLKVDVLFKIQDYFNIPVSLLFK